MNPEDLTPEDRRFLARESSMPTRAYDRLAKRPTMPRAAYSAIAVREAKRRQRARTVKALAWLGVTVLALVAIASLPYFLH